MRKTGKILFILVLAFMLIGAFTSISKAATEVDYTGYKEVAEEQDEDTKGTTETTKTTEEQKENLSNKATESHSQAGSFETANIIGTSTVLLIVAGIGYAKYKKYNF